MLISVDRKITKTGREMALATLEDETGSCRVVIFPTTYGQAAHVLQPGNLVVVTGVIGTAGARDPVGPHSEGDGAEALIECVADRVLGIEDPRARAFRPRESVHLTCPADPELMSRIQEVVLENPGPYLVVLHPAGSAGPVPLSPRTRVASTPAVAAEMRRLCGPHSWRMVPTDPSPALKHFRAPTDGVTLAPLRPTSSVGGSPPCRVR